VGIHSSTHLCVVTHIYSKMAAKRILPDGKIKWFFYGVKTKDFTSVLDATRENVKAQFREFASLQRRRLLRMKNPTLIKEDYVKHYQVKDEDLEAFVANADEEEKAVLAELEDLANKHKEAAEAAEEIQANLKLLNMKEIAEKALALKGHQATAEYLQTGASLTLCIVTTSENGLRKVRISTRAGSKELFVKYLVIIWRTTRRTRRLN
jgi:vacuolar-type H+-ATPase subunit I/STV1